MAGTARKAAVRPALFAVAALVGALNAGCSASPAPPSGAGPSSSASRAPLTVPAVSNPLDATRFLNAPCELITEQQADELGLPFAQKQRSAGPVTCVWRADQNHPNPLEALQIRFHTGDGVAGMARQCGNRTDCDSWTVDTIADYPVIRANGRLESKYGVCRLFVGVADTVAFLVTDGDLDAIQKGAIEGDAGGPRCDRADRAVTMVVQKLKEGR